MKSSMRCVLAVTGIVGLFVLPVSHAQERPAVDVPPGGTEPTTDYEVYNRGPLHEAFATPAATDPVRGEIVNVEPPEPIDEVPPEQKPEGDNVVWIPGYWEFDVDLGDFLWISGVWRDVPPGRTWVPGYWTQSGRGYQRVAGMWAASDVEEVAYLPEPPRSQERGPSSPSPGEGYFWVPGSWEYYDTDYRWRPGYWAPHQRDWIWVPACYSYTPRGYVYVPGYWDYQLAYRGLAFAPVYFHNQRYGRPFAPNIALDSWGHLMLHLFVNPRYGRYYFGDYYGARYADYGFTPFYSYHRQSGYDPLFVYFSWRFGNNYYDRLDGWHRYFAAHDEFRPRRTFREQRQFYEQNRDNRVVAATTVATTLDNVVRSRDVPVAFTSVSGPERERFTDQARQLRVFTRERNEVESQTQADTRVRRPTLRIQDNEQLRIRSEAPREESRQRIEAPERPDRMQGIQPDDRDGRRARIPSRHGRNGDQGAGRPESGRPDVDNQPGRRERPDVREQPGRTDRPEGRERPEIRGPRDLPRLPDGPGVERGRGDQPEQRPEVKDRGRSGQRPDRGRGQQGSPDRGSRSQGPPDRGTSPGAVPDRGGQDLGEPEGSPRERPDRGRRDRDQSNRDRPERGQSGERPRRGQSGERSQQGDRDSGKPSGDS